MYDVAPAREHDPWHTTTVTTEEVEITRGKNKGKTKEVRKRAQVKPREHVDEHGNVWHTSDPAREHYARDDANAREAEAGQKPVKRLPGTDEYAPSWVDYGAVRDDYTRRHVRPVYDDLTNAQHSDKYLPKSKGGRGKRDPMSRAALDARDTREARAHGVTDTSEFTRQRRTTSTGETYVNPHGAPTYRTITGRDGKQHVLTQNGNGRAMHGPAGYLRYWVRETESIALRNIDDANRKRGKDVTVEMTRGTMKLWLQLHNVQVERGKLTDNGRAEIISSIIAGMSATDTASMRVYSRTELRKFALRNVPARYRKGLFGEFLEFLTSI